VGTAQGDICKVQASLFAIWNWWGRNVSRLIGKDVIVVVGQDFGCEVEFSQKAFLVHMRVCSLPPIIHIHPKELVLPKFQKPSFPT